MSCQKTTGQQNQHSRCGTHGWSGRTVLPCYAAPSITPLDPNKGLVCLLVCNTVTCLPPSCFQRLPHCKWLGVEGISEWVISFSEMSSARRGILGKNRCSYEAETCEELSCRAELPSSGHWALLHIWQDAAQSPLVWISAGLAFTAGNVAFAQGLGSSKQLQLYLNTVLAVSFADLPGSRCYS